MLFNYSNYIYAPYSNFVNYPPNVVFFQTMIQFYLAHCIWLLLMFSLFQARMAPLPYLFFI